MGEVELRSHRERPIPPKAVRELYEHVGWHRPGDEGDVAEVLERGPAVGAWEGDRLVGFVRALSDGRFAAYVEDVMVHEAYRRGGVDEKLMVRLMEEIGGVANVNLFCEQPVVGFYEGSGFDRTPYVLMQRTGASRTSQNFPSTHLGE
jgi:ribosomal protein S18 acetylase RimI-like enzyme